MISYATRLLNKENTSRTAHNMRKREEKTLPYERL